MAGERARAKMMVLDSGDARLRIATRPPAAHLAPYVGEYCGYVESKPGVLRRREFPRPIVAVLFELGPPIAIVDHRNGGRVLRFRGGFVAGMDDSYTDTEHEGFQEGLQVNFTPVGARLFFGIPMAELAGRVVAMSDLFDLEARRVCVELAEAPGWDARFDLLDAFLTRRITRSRADGRVVAWAFDRITAQGGQVDVGALARDTGYSQKHLITLFRDFVGVTPKVVARIVRFDRVVQRLKAGHAGSWAELAADLGFYDQAHLVRDFHQFAGATPTETRRMLAEIPDTGEALGGGEVNSFQDR